MYKFEITHQPIDPQALKAGLISPGSGAFCEFSGIVRDHNDGRSVRLLEYEAHSPICEKEAAKILHEAKSRFDVMSGYCMHRVGPLHVGETAVWIGIAAAHRKSAFEACQFIIDNIKLRLPIWKKEYYVDGVSEWVNCQGCLDAKKDAKKAFNARNFYSRQVTLPQIGSKGQEKLNRSSVLVVGAGGLGTAALSGLAGAGIGRIGVCESDVLDESNLHRQFIYAHNAVGQPKVKLAAEYVRRLNPSLEVGQFPVLIGPDNVRDIIKDFDVILDCTDNFKAKFLLNDAAVLYKKSLVHASIYQWEGQVRVVLPGQTSCLRCQWPQMPDPGCVGTCADVGVLGAVPNLFGHLQAMEAVKCILDIGSSADTTVLIDLRDHSLRTIRQRRNPSCPVCSDIPSIRAIDKSLYEPASEVLIDLSSKTLDELKEYNWIDIREPAEIVSRPVPFMQCEQRPLSCFDINDAELNTAHDHLLLCTKGVRSRRLAERLRAAGNKNVYSVSGGLEALERYLRNRSNHKTHASSF